MWLTDYFDVQGGLKYNRWNNTHYFGSYRS